jgi:hypothetical protein
MAYLAASTSIVPQYCSVRSSSCAREEHRVVFGSKLQNSLLISPLGSRKVNRTKRISGVHLSGRVAPVTAMAAGMCLSCCWDCHALKLRLRFRVVSL